MNSATTCSALLLLSLSSSSCVRASWSRVDVGRPIPDELHEELAPSSTDLTRCLEQLGAPLFVWEISGEEYGLAYGWDHATGWGLNVSIPVSRSVSASVDYESLAQQLHGVVLIFDAHDRLLRKRTGFLGEIVGAEGRRRPAFVEPASTEDGQG